MDRRLALVAGCGMLADPRLDAFSLSGADHNGIAGELADGNKGAYEVRSLVDTDAAALDAGVHALFADAKPGDVALLYYAGPVLVDAAGRAFLTGRDTDPDTPLSSAIPLSRLAGYMESSHAATRMAVLDCAYIVLGDLHDTQALEPWPHLARRTGGSLTVLASGLAPQFTFHQDRLTRVGSHGCFTDDVVEGLRSGHLDLDWDGNITLAEVDEFVRRHMQGVRAPVDPLLHGECNAVFATNHKAREAEALETCFVISPLSDHRERADHVLETYIRPACAEVGLKAVRSDMMLQGEDLLTEIMGDLRSSPVVIAYLGQPYWNPNVMLEVGYRLATRGPIVLLREPQTRQNEPPLPFNLRDNRLIFLPDKREERDAPARLQETVHEISALLKTHLDTHRQHLDAWETPYPVATIHYHLDKREGVIAHASRQAEVLFDLNRPLKGLTLSELIERLENLMSKEQFVAFNSEQAALIGRLVAPFHGSEEVPVARRPIFVTRHGREEYRGRAFLPVIYRYSPRGTELWLKVIYLDVTSAVEHTGATCHCILREEPPSAPPPPVADVARIGPR